jgi:hypothetical protein
MDKKRDLDPDELESIRRVKEHHIKEKTKYMVRFSRANTYFEVPTSQEIPSLAIQEVLMRVGYLSRSWRNENVCVYKFNLEYPADGWETTIDGDLVWKYKDTEKVSEDEYDLSPEDWFYRTGELVDDIRQMKRKFRCFRTEEGGKTIVRFSNKSQQAKPDPANRRRIAL